MQAQGKAVEAQGKAVSHHTPCQHHKQRHPSLAGWPRERNQRQWKRRKKRGRITHRASLQSIPMMLGPPAQQRPCHTAMRASSHIGRELARPLALALALALLPPGRCRGQLYSRVMPESSPSP